MFHMDDEIYERLVLAKNDAAKRNGKGSLGWLEYFLMVSR